MPLSLTALGATPGDLAIGLRATTAKALVRIRQSSRSGAAGWWREATGVHDSPVAVAGDAERSTRVADSIAAQWSRKLDAARDETDSYPAAVRKARSDIEPALDRAATTETVHAWNEETAAHTAYAESLGLVVVETWEAILDRRTCPVCDAMAGQTVTRPERFPQEPPLHPLCRCFLSVDVFARKAA